VAGTTASTDFQVPGKVTPVFESTNQAETHAGPPSTAGFVTELNPTLVLLNQVRYSTYFGGGGLQIVPPAPATGTIGVGDAIVDLATTGTLLYVTGATASASGTGTFPVSANACQTKNNSRGIVIWIASVNFNVPITAFASELDPSKSTSRAQLAFSTLLGGTGTADAGTGLAIDPFGDMVISGLTYSSDFPVTTTAFQTSNNASGAKSTNAFLSVLYPLGTLCTLGGGTPVPTPSASPSPSPSPTPGGKIAISANPVVFPNAGVGGAPTQKNFLIQNLSGKYHLVGNVGAASAQFSFISGNGAFDLGPLGMEKVKMLFTPTAIGLQKGSLLITSNDKLYPLGLTVNLRGTGLPGHLATNIPVPPLFLQILSFGRVPHNGTPKSLSFKIKNIGKGELKGSVGTPAAPFSVTAGPGAFDLAPGATKTITVQFAPTGVGRFSVPLLISVTPPGKPVAGITVTLNGRVT